MAASFFESHIEIMADCASYYVRDYYVITITTNGCFQPRNDESWLQALVRLIAYQMAEPPAGAEMINKFHCDVKDLLNRLQEINNQGRSVVLLIDELNKLGVPLDDETSAFLIQHFLDKEGRYLIFSSRVHFHVDSSLASKAMHAPCGRTMLTLPLPFCTDRSLLQNMLQVNVTDLQITLAVGIPSILYLMNKHDRAEMTFEERFDYVIERCVGGGRNGPLEEAFLEANRATLLDAFLTTVIEGAGCGMTVLEVFTTPVEDPRKKYRFPLEYIPIILQFLGENDGVALFNSLKASAETEESGGVWELLVVYSIYIRSLAAKHCKNTVPLLGPFDIATDGVEDVKVMTIPADMKSADEAVEYIQDTTQTARTIYIFRMADSKFSDFDGFVSYKGRDSALSIHGFQCKLTKGYPHHPIDTRHIARGWFLRGGPTINTPDRDGWTFPTEEQIETKLLGFGLRPLQPMAWGAACV